MEDREEKLMREANDRRRQKAKERVQGNERQQRYRDRNRARKIAEGWIPGQKRVSVPIHYTSHD
jgi:hypothetical protein